MRSQQDLKSPQSQRATGDKWSEDMQIGKSETRQIGMKGQSEIKNS